MTRQIPHGEAKKIAQRLINSHFRQEPGARIGIPARPDYDDDLLMMAYIAQQKERDDALREFVAIADEWKIVRDGVSLLDRYKRQEAAEAVARRLLNSIEGE